MPLVSRTFDQLIDFTRTSAATYADASGRIVPTPASRNLLTFTQEFDNAGWVKNGTTITANAATAPDGTLTAGKLVENTANAEHRAARTETLVAGTYTLSCYVKAAERGFFVFRENINGSIVDTFFNLNTGVVASTGAGRTSSITSAGNGWYRCAVTATSTGGSATLGFDISDNGARIVYTGTAGLGIYLWGAQLEANTTATDYTRNNGGVYPPRFDYDPATLAPKGLLIEEARTNLFLYSEDLADATWGKNWGGGVSVTSNQANGPDGAQNLDLVTSSGLDGAAYQSFAIAFNAAHSVSFFVRQGTAASSRLEISNAVSGPTASVTFSWTGGVPSTSSTGGTPTNIKFENYGGGLYRVSFSFVSDGSGANFVLFAPDSTAGLGTSYAGYFQLEAGAFATSYIPTVASQVTRTADVATITGANFSQWYNQSEGTFVVDFDTIMLFPASTAPTQVLSVSDGTSNNRMTIFCHADLVGGQVRQGGATQAQLYFSSIPSGVNKAFLAYKTNDVAATFNGAVAQVDTSATIPTVDRMGIGIAPSSAYLNGHIRSIRYYPTRLSNAQLQALTA